jgi:hypothetical protein
LKYLQEHGEFLREEDKSNDKNYFLKVSRRQLKKADFEYKGLRVYVIFYSNLEKDMILKTKESIHQKLIQIKKMNTKILEVEGQTT